MTWRWNPKAPPGPPARRVARPVAPGLVRQADDANVAAVGWRAAKRAAARADDASSMQLASRPANGARSYVRALSGAVLEVDQRHVLLAACFMKLPSDRTQMPLVIKMRGFACARKNPGAIVASMAAPCAPSPASPADRC